MSTTRLYSEVISARAEKNKDSKLDETKLKLKQDRKQEDQEAVASLKRHKPWQHTALLAASFGRRQSAVCSPLMTLRRGSTPAHVSASDLSTWRTSRSTGAKTHALSTVSLYRCKRGQLKRVLYIYADTALSSRSARVVVRIRS